MSASPVPPPQGSNKAVWWILGILAGGALVLVLAVLILIPFFVRQMHIHQSADRVEIQTPVGAIKVNKNEVHPTGLPVYPAATLEDNERTNVEFSAHDETVGISVERYDSGDSIDDVQAWYRRRLGPEFRLEMEHQHPKWNSGDKYHIGDADVAFVDDSGDSPRLVALTKNSGGTKIVLFRAGKKELQ
jgi:hypothetical protein